MPCLEDTDVIDERVIGEVQLSTTGDPRGSWELYIGYGTLYFVFRPGLLNNKHYYLWKKNAESL